MKSKKAKEFIWYLDNKEQSTAATHAVKLAEKEMQEKAIEAFCDVHCPDGIFTYKVVKYSTCKECRDYLPCPILEMFMNQLNDKQIWN